MPDDFVPFGAWLRPRSQPAPGADAHEMQQPHEAQEDEAPDAEIDALDDALAEARRFRAALADALDAALTDLLAAIAREVLGRELLLAEADLRAIVTRALERYAIAEPLALRVHPDDVTAFDASDIQVIADERLRHGDAVLDVRSGTIDATLAARLDRVLAAFGAA